MYRRSLQIAIFCTLSIAIGCGSGSSSSSQSGGTSVNVKFAGSAPLAVAVQTGTGSFSTAALSGDSLSVSVPSGTDKYAVGYACPPMPGFGNTVTSEYIVEASLSDSTSYTLTCGGTLSTGSVTGSVDATAISGAANVYVRGNSEYGFGVGAASGALSGTLPTGTNDVAFLAVDGSSNVLAVKIIRNQTIPGAVNGGATVTFAAADKVTTQTWSITNIASGFVTPPAVAVYYYTANGTYFLLDNNSATQYPAVPAAAAASGDFYGYESNTTDSATESSVGFTQTTTSGGGTATFALPAPWSYAGPTPATFPTFNFSYADFSSLAAISQQAIISWAPTAATATEITVTATSSYQAGANAITIPDLSALAGFSTFAAAPAGTTISWDALVYGGTEQEFQLYGEPPPSSGTQAFVQNEGTYSQP